MPVTLAQACNPLCDFTDGGKCCWLHVLPVGWFVQVIRARVPLIAFVDAQTGIAVDISVQNHGGVFKSNFTRELSQFDSRFVSLYRLVSGTHCTYNAGVRVAHRKWIHFSKTPS